jgi:tetratricopeptide (TPR) repeat protein
MSLRFSMRNNPIFRGAAKNFESAYQWDGDQPEVAYNLGLAQFKAGNFASAAEPLWKAETLQPKRKEIQALLGMTYLFNHNYQSAAELEPLSKGGVEDPELMYGLGLSLAHTGVRARANKVCAACVSVRSSHVSLGYPFERCSS